MGRLFTPDEVYPSVKEISVRALKTHDIRIVFCDLDNTLARWNDTFIPASARAFSASLYENRIDLCIISNNDRERVYPAARALLATCVPSAGKPGTAAIKKMLAHKNIPAENAVMIGDQVLTDILAGNLAGLHTILVNPIDPSREFGGTRVNRIVESIVCFLFRIQRTR